MYAFTRAAMLLLYLRCTPVHAPAIIHMHTHSCFLIFLGEVPLSFWSARFRFLDLTISNFCFVATPAPPPRTRHPPPPSHLCHTAVADGPDRRRVPQQPRGVPPRPRAAAPRPRRRHGGRPPAAQLAEGPPPTGDPPGGGRRSAGAALVGGGGVVAFFLQHWEMQCGTCSGVHRSHATYEKEMRGK